MAGLWARRDGLADYKCGVMQRLFSRELRFTCPDGIPFPDWQQKRLGDVADRVIERNNELANQALTNSAHRALLIRALSTGTSRMLTTSQAITSLRKETSFTTRASLRRHLLGLSTAMTLGPAGLPLYTVFRFHTDKTSSLINISNRLPTSLHSEQIMAQGMTGSVFQLTFLRCRYLNPTPRSSGRSRDFSARSTAASTPLPPRSPPPRPSSAASSNRCSSREGGDEHS